MFRTLNKNYNLALIGLCFLAAFLVLSYSTYVEIRNNFTTQIKNSLDNSASKVENSLVDTIKHTEYVMKMLNNQIARNPLDKKYLNNVISKFRVDTSNDGALPWTVFAWVDSHHYLTVDGDLGIIESPENLKDRDYMPKTITRPDVIHLGKPVYGVPSRKWVIPSGVGYVDEYGTYLGATVIGFDLNLMSKSIARKINNPNVNFVITDTQNNLYIDSEKKEQGPQFSEQSILGEIREYAESENKEPAYDVFYSGNSDSYMIKRVAGTDFIIAVKYNSAVVAAAYKQVVLTSIPKIILIGLLFIFVGYLILREKRLKKTTMKLHNKTIQQSKAKNDFLAYTGHELRSPLNGILFGSEMIMKKMFGEIHPKYMEYVQDIHQNSMDLLHFIEDLIDVTRAEDGNFSLHKEVVDIDECVKRVINLNSARAAKSGIKIETFIEKGMPDLYADPKRLRQILNNLITNSIKYSPDRTTIKIIVHSVDELTQVVVEDQGFGLTKDELEIAVSKYGTVDNENRGKVDSIGLGLPLVKKLVESHGARFEIESQKGHGTRVTLSFPIHLQDKPKKDNVIVLKKEKLKL